MKYERRGKEMKWFEGLKNGEVERVAAELQIENLNDYMNEHVYPFTSGDHRELSTNTILDILWCISCLWESFPKDIKSFFIRRIVFRAIGDQKVSIPERGGVGMGEDEAIREILREVGVLGFVVDLAGDESKAVELFRDDFRALVAMSQK